MTKQFIASECYTLVGGKISGLRRLGVFRDVPIYWVVIDLVSFNNIFLCVYVDEFARAGIQLTTKDHHHGSYKADELFDAILGDIYS